MKYRIYLSPPSHSETEIEAVTQAIESGWISTQGPANQEFTNYLSHYLGREVLLTNSGTSALHLALIVAGVKENDWVLCSNFSFIASAYPILYQKANPVFIGIESDSWNLSPQFLENALQSMKTKPKALITTHIYGCPANLNKIIEICNHYNVILIEDAAEALGAIYHDKPLGTFGEFGVLSFNGNKIVTTSSGGALLTQNAKSLERATKIASQAKEMSDYYEHKEVGYNYLQSNVLSAFGLAQIQNLNQRVQKRREIFEIYKNELSKHFEILYQSEPENSISNRWLSSFVFEKGKAQEIKQKLKEHKIESRYLFSPLHQQEVFKGSLYFGDDTEVIYFQNGLSLPSGFELKEDEQQQIINILKNSL